MEINGYTQEQKAICKKYFLNEDLVDLNSLIVIGRNFNPKLQINGLRHPRTDSLCGWYIWSGPDLDSAEDFFKPLHVHHLIDNSPLIIKYLGLPPGMRFLIDDKGYEDVWEDVDLLNV